MAEQDAATSSSSVTVQQEDSQADGFEETRCAAPPFHGLGDSREAEHPPPAAALLPR